MPAQNRLDLSQSVSLELPLKQVNRGLDMLREKENNLVRLVANFSE